MDHDWAPIAPGEDDALMRTVCCQCQCCETPSEECPGEWIPDEEDGFWEGPTEKSRELLRKWRESKYPYREAVKSLTGATSDEIERLGGLNR